MNSDDTTSDYDKRQWQAEQAVRDAAIEKQRDKERKTRERAARNAQRKLERLHKTLTDKGEISQFEDEFGQSVLERLDKFGAAFHDLEKGRPGDALSFAQKSVLAAMNKKVKSLKKQSAAPNTPASDTGESGEDNFDDGYERTADRWKSKTSTSKKRSSFSSKSKPKFTPRVRHIEDDFVDGDVKDADNPKNSYEAIAPELKDQELKNQELKNRVPFLPEYLPKKKIAPLANPQSKPSEANAQSEPPKRPFLRLVT